MYGFTVIQSAEIKKELLPETKKSFFFSLANNTSIFFGYNYFTKFSNDKIFEENSNYTIGIDGVVLNLQQLKNEYSISNYFDLITYLFEKHQIQFVSFLKGEFNGFIFDKRNEKLFFFNNKTGTKQIFYSSFSGYHIISQSIELITSFKKKHNVSSRLNILSVYDMLTFGATIENKTLVEEVYRLQGGKYLQLENLSIIEKEYHSYNNIKESNSPKKELLEKLDHHFKNALVLEYQKDIEYNYDHFALLSGGLDSRMNVMLAHKIGFINNTLCFSIPNYEDQKIAKQITDKYSLPHSFISLDEGEYMTDLQENFLINNAMCFFTGSAHYNFALRNTNIDDFGLVHSGQIGDGILGSLLSKENNYFSKTITNQFLEKCSVTKSTLKNYKNEEVFKLYQNVFNRTHTGSFTTEYHKTYLVSPFLDDDVIATSLSIQKSLKVNQDIYLDWINKYHPETTKFVWERTGFKPNKKWKTKLSRYTNKFKNEVYKIKGKVGKTSMAPEDFWLKNNIRVNNFFKDFFNENIELLQDDLQLFKDVNTYYKGGDSTGKAVVLTILKAVKYYNLQL